MHRDNPADKLYVIVRGDLPLGLQMAQVAHACIEFALNHPEKASSTPVGVVLCVPDEPALLELADRLIGWCGPHVDLSKPDNPVVVFHDPDVGEGGEHTALALVTSGEEFAHLPLAGKVPALV